MRQAIMTSPGIIEYREIPKPELVGPGEVLLKIERIGVCGIRPHPTRWSRGMSIQPQYMRWENM
jgi:threonine dehydrogenase-like Zn-dependent dehydrogenase